MAMDEQDEAKSSAEAEGQSAQAAPAGAPEEEDRGARVDAAKAFFRAMYAGDEAPPATSNFAKQPTPETSTQTACRNCESLTQLARDAEAKAAESDTLYKRMAADFENYRRRMDRERDESVSLGVKKAAEAIVPALDDLDRALMYLSPDTPSDKLIESFKLVANRIMHCLDSVGLKRLKAIGEQFDPRYHEPVQQVETTEHVDGAVMQELRAGYVLGDKIVRPALVNVASNSSGVLPQVVLAAEPAPEEGIEAMPAPEVDVEEVSAEIVDQEPPSVSEHDDNPSKVYDLGDIE